MVGAGLSRQTEQCHPIEVRPPSWRQLAIGLQEELRSGTLDSGQRPAPESVSARDCSRLAQQYKASFGQSALDSFLLAKVPDGKPSSVHERLLRLPWADVFTTNWDTLLEKAAKKGRRPNLRPSALLRRPSDDPCSSHRQAARFISVEPTVRGH